MSRLQPQLRICSETTFGSVPFSRNYWPWYDAGVADNSRSDSGDDGAPAATTEKSLHTRHDSSVMIQSPPCVRQFGVDISHAVPFPDSNKRGQAKGQPPAHQLKSLLFQCT